MIVNAFTIILLSLAAAEYQNFGPTPIRIGMGTASAEALSKAIDETLGNVVNMLLSADRTANYVSEGIQKMNPFKLSRHQHRVEVLLKKSTKHLEELHAAGQSAHMMHQSLMILGALLMVFSIVGMISLAIRHKRQQSNRWDEWQNSEQSEPMLSYRPDDQV